MPNVVGASRAVVSQNYIMLSLKLYHALKRHTLAMLFRALDNKLWKSTATHLLLENQASDTTPSPAVAKHVRYYPEAAGCKTRACLTKEKLSRCPPAVQRYNPEAGGCKTRAILPRGGRLQNTCATNPHKSSPGVPSRASARPLG